MIRRPLSPEEALAPRPRNRFAFDERIAGFYLVSFIVFQIVNQVALVFYGSVGGLRIWLRTASYAASLGMLFFVPGHGRPHPARGWALAILVIVSLGFFHPTRNTIVASATQIAYYFAILSPIFWVARLHVTPALLRRILLAFWGYHVASSAAAVLQVYFPGRFQPTVSGLIEKDYLESLKITLSSGEQIFRPMGLSDVPGAVATSGLYAVCLGLGFFLIGRSWPLRATALLGMATGLFAIYLSQARYALVMTGVCVMTLFAMFLRRGEYTRLLNIMVIVAALAVGSGWWAISVGGASVTNRLNTLIEEPAGDVYYKNRGRFLDDTVNLLLPLYPLGAGLGRWGMTFYYFGDDNYPDSPNIWVEIQWTGWLLDGGLPLITCYVIALLVTCTATWRIATGGLRGDLPILAAVVFAYDVACLASTFNCCVFQGQGGIEFWLLNTAAFVAACNARRQEVLLARSSPP
jgi:hypothetical protein